MSDTKSSDRIKRGILGLAVLCALASPTKAKQVFLTDGKFFKATSRKLEFYMNDLRNPLNSQGFFRIKSNLTDFYFRRFGLFNYQYGFESGDGFFNFRKYSKRIKNEEFNIISSIDISSHDYEAGCKIYLLKSPKLSIGVGRAESQKDLESKVICIQSSGSKNGKELITKLEGELKEQTTLINLKSKFGYITLIKNSLSSETLEQKKDEENKKTIKNKNLKRIYFFSPAPELVGYAYDTNHHAYLAKYWEDFGIFIRLNFKNMKNSALVIESSNLKEFELTEFHRDIENYNREVPRIYDLKYETNKRLAFNPFFENNFRIKLKKGKKPEFSLSKTIKLKYVNFYLTLKEPREINVAMSPYLSIIMCRNKRRPLGRVIMGIDNLMGKNKTIYIGYQR